MGLDPITWIQVSCPTSPMPFHPVVLVVRAGDSLTVVLEALSECRYYGAIENNRAGLATISFSMLSSVTPIPFRYGTISVST